MDGIKSVFPTTKWTAVVEAACSGDLQQRQQALTGLYQDYWMPLYAFSRRLGNDRHDAEDLTQGFFAYLLQHAVLDSANREMGTLRTFLLRVFQRYIGDVRDRENAQKRGGGVQLLSLDFNEEDMPFAGMDSSENPEVHYDRAWAHAVLRGTLQQLAALERAADRGRQFTVLEPCLNPEADADASHVDYANALGISVEAVRQTVSRLRKKFRDCLRERIAATLQEPDDARIDEELRALKAVLRG
ncbi:MAG TPA: sigma-70 family RNA polymerase sigma factor [Prosthecobacter sp.]